MAAGTTCGRSQDSILEYYHIWRYELVGQQLFP
jgi:hypothetical protein